MPTKGNRADIIVLNAVEGFGKTTIGAFAPNAAIIMAPQETGYLTLYNNGRAPQCPNAVVSSYPALLAKLDGVLKSPGTIQTLVIDALIGMERMCHEYVCETQFSGDWGEKGFLSFQKGYEISIAEWLKCLDRLSRIRDLGITVLMLSHSRIRPYKNPRGADFDRFISDCHEKTWSVTHKWADHVLFGDFFTVVTDVDKTKKRGKGIGGQQRVVYTEHCDAWDAKNRAGMDAEIDMGNDYTQMWSILETALKGSK